jgi:DNA polymerase III alpha subunit
MELKGRYTDQFGNVIFKEEGLCDLLLRGHDIAGLSVMPCEGMEHFNAVCKEFDHPEDSLTFYDAPKGTVEEFDAQRQAKWFVPEPWASLDVLEWLAQKCETEEQLQRVALEWELFMERDMEQVLRFLIYLVDHLRERGVLWGVGRGSSVSSYCLYLIGVHRVDSLKYNLDPREFLK